MNKTRFLLWLIVGLLVATILESFSNHFWNSGKVAYFEGATFWQFANPSSNLEADCPKSYCGHPVHHTMEDIFLKIISPAIGGIIAGMAGIISVCFQSRIAAEKQRKDHADEFLGMLGRWESKCKNLTASGLKECHPLYSEALWGYCGRFRSEFRNPTRVIALCEELEVSAKKATENDASKDEMLEKIRELKSFL